jgi:outer membrane protein
MRAIRIQAILIALLGAAALASAQQITRIAVVDLNRVIAAYSRDAGPYKDFELRKSQIQTEIDRMGEEIRRLQSQKVDADKAGDRQGSLRFDSDIYKKTEFLKDYVRTKQAELEDQARKLTISSPFVQQVYKMIQQIAETEGYSLVLNLKSADSVVNSVIWYSPMIDITDKVIQILLGNAQ